MPKRIVSPVLALAVALPLAADTPAGTWRLDSQRSVFAVLTHRAGLAARLAHDHLVVAVGATAALDFDPERPEAARFAARANVLALEIDAPAARAELGPRLVELGALAAPLPPVAPDDRVKVRTAMLARDQLDAGDYPEIAGELVGLAPRAGGGNSGPLAALDWDARVRLTVRGRTVERTVPARWRVADGELTAEVVGDFRFSEFGITPYSRFLGAVANEDLFQLYVRLVARRAPADAAGGLSG